jgi:hypothetical protein
MEKSAALTVAQRLAAFDPALHGGEAMATGRVGKEAFQRTRTRALAKYWTKSSRSGLSTSTRLSWLMQISHDHDSVRILGTLETKLTIKAMSVTSSK